MKPPLLILLFFLLSFEQKTFSQAHMMKVNDSLKRSGEFITVKRKSIFGAAKYEFGPYKIISSRKGIETTKTKSKLFSNISESESKQSSSFVFTANEKDTVVVNLFVQNNYKTTTSKSIVLENGKLKTEREQNSEATLRFFQAELSVLSDTISWQLGYLTRFGRDSSDVHSPFLLSDGKTDIEIHEITEADDGKFSLIWTFHGYEFILNGKAVMAVQTMAKQYVWMDKGLDEKMKTILAAAAATLLFHEF